MIFNREPALFLAAVEAIIALAIGFGLDITTEQFSLIMLAVTAVLGLITRQVVTSRATLEEDYIPRSPQ